MSGLRGLTKNRASWLVKLFQYPVPIFERVRVFPKMVERKLRQEVGFSNGNAYGMVTQGS